MIIVNIWSDLNYLVENVYSLEFLNPFCIKNVIIGNQVFIRMQNY